MKMFNWFDDLLNGISFNEKNSLMYMWVVVEFYAKMLNSWIVNYTPNDINLKIIPKFKGSLKIH